MFRTAAEAFTLAANGADKNTIAAKFREAVAPAMETGAEAPAGAFIAAAEAFEQGTKDAFTKAEGDFRTAEEMAADIAANTLIPIAAAEAAAVPAYRAAAEAFKTKADEL